MATVTSAKATLVNKIDALTSGAVAKDTIFLAKALKEATNSIDTGSAGQVLKTDSAGTGVEWAADGGLPSGGSTGQVVTNTGSGTGDWQTPAATYTHPTGAGDKHIPTGGSSAQVLTYSASGTATWAAPAAGGKVLQVVQTTITNTPSVSSNTSWENIPSLDLSITPAFATSKILIMAMINRSQDGAHDSALRLARGSTGICVGAGTYGATTGDNHRDPHEMGMVTMTYLDSPATTTATTYRVQFWDNNGNTTYINREWTFSSSSEDPTGASTIILMEIGA